MLALTNEQKALFALLGADMDISDNTDWSEVEKEAAQQAVYLLVANSKKRPANIDWGNRVFQYTASNLKGIYAVTELDKIMRSHGLQYVILKGLASASYYPYYMHRILGDCDFLIDANEKEKVMNILLGAGYEMSGEGNNHHVVFRKPDQDLEMHFEIPGVPNGERGKYVREYIKDILNESLTYKAQGFEISVPQAKYHGLVLLLHMQHHMLSEGIGLRHLMDWCVFVDRTHTEEFWKTDLLPIIKKIGLFKYAQVMTKVGGMYLNTVCPEWCEAAEEDLCDAVMQDLLTGGNFGRKNKARSAAGMMISQHGKDGTYEGKIVNLWKTMLGAVKGYHYKTLEKYPVLYPVFMVEFVARRIWNVCTGKRISLRESSKYVEERKSIYERLEIFD